MSRNPGANLDSKVYVGDLGKLSFQPLFQN